MTVYIPPSYSYEVLFDNNKNHVLLSKFYKTEDAKREFEKATGWKVREITALGKI